MISLFLTVQLSVRHLLVHSQAVLMGLYDNRPGMSQGAMAMKRYFTISSAPRLGPGLCYWAPEDLICYFFSLACLLDSSRFGVWI